jgi:cytochrome c oxidase subunit 4
MDFPVPPFIPDHLNSEIAKWRKNRNPEIVNLKSKDMTAESVHITSYRTYLWVLIALLFLTFVTITVTWVDLSALTVLVAMIIASVKAYIVLTWFMHLKFESSLFRVLVIVVLAIYALVIGLTFFDYLLR